MRRFQLSLSRTASIVLFLVFALPAAAQRHSSGSAPPTPPPLPVSPVPSASTPTAHGFATAPAQHATALTGAATGPIAPVSTGLGAIQFQPANFTVPAPQTLTRQLSAEDEHTRAGALASLGVPGQYLVHGHVPIPHSIQLDLVQLGMTDDLDALLTVELDQHLVSAVLLPEDGLWRRVATLSFATSFSAGATTPASFVRPLRSLLAPGRYRAMVHATVNSQNGDFTENEADVRILNGRAVVVMSFVSGARQCEAPTPLHPGHQPCEILQRWLEPDPIDPTHHFTLITGIGHFSPHEAEDPLSHSRSYRMTRLRSFSCQPFGFSEAAQHFEPLANSAACAARETPQASSQAPHSGMGDHPLP